LRIESTINPQSAILNPQWKDWLGCNQSKWPIRTLVFTKTVEDGP